MSTNVVTSWSERAPTLWQAPLLPVALAFTFGVVLDHFFAISMWGSVTAAILLIAAWAVLTVCSAARQWAVLAIILAAAGFGSAYHHSRLRVQSADDVSHLVAERPRVIHLRGELLEDPRQYQRRDARLYPVYVGSRPSPPAAFTVLQVKEFRAGDHWIAVAGKVKVSIFGGNVHGLRGGETVQFIGMLSLPRGPSNPGEPDYARRMREQGIHAELVVRDARDGVTRLRARSSTSIQTWLASLRSYGVNTLDGRLPIEQSRLASAILLGRVDALSGDELDKFKQTGVVHVLVISGQHFFVLAVFVQMMLRLFQVRLRRRAVLVSLFLLTYAFLVGLRPPVLRATVTFLAIFGGALLRRFTFFPNAFAAAWLVVLLIDPNEAFQTGCQLSFLAVAVLHWIVGPWLRPRQEQDPLDRLVDESRRSWVRALRWVGRAILLYYLTTLIVWIALVPLVASRSHLVPIAGLLIAPPVMIAISIALISGFLLLSTAPWFGLLADVFAWVTQWSLRLCQEMIHGVTQWPFSYRWVTDVPVWWLIGFYLILTTAILAQLWPRHRPRLLIVALAWLCFGLAPLRPRQPDDELRVTFLDVGHGTCIVMELPDGRVLVYDAGSIRNPGPAVTRSRIAPYLWHRGIRRIDELFLSHADLDHYNGIPELVERFTIGQVSCSSTFAEKQSPEVRQVLHVLRDKQLPLRILKAGDVLQAGAVTIDVLHPPATGPPGKENVRSLVLLVRHGRHDVLLTGDVEGAGMQQVKPLLQQPIEVLMAPHHGSLTVPPGYQRRGVAPADLARWTRPRVVISSQNKPWEPRPPNPYEKAGARLLRTWDHGAITVRSHASGLVVETFRTKETFVVEAHEP